MTYETKRAHFKTVLLLAVGQFAANKSAVCRFAVYKFAVWTVRRTDSLPYGQFAVRTVCRKTVGRMTILPYGQFAVKRYFTQILQKNCI